MIVSPRGLVRNVPLSLRPPRRSWIGTDSDEYEGTDGRGRTGTGKGGDVDVAGSRDVDGRELSPGEAAGGPVSGEGRERFAAWECWSDFESGDERPHADAGAPADSGEIRRGDRRALWPDPGGRASGE